MFKILCFNWCSNSHNVKALRHYFSSLNRERGLCPSDSYFGLKNRAETKPGLDMWMCCTTFAQNFIIMIESPHHMLTERVVQLYSAQKAALQGVLSKGDILYVYIPL